MSRRPRRGGWATVPHARLHRRVRAARGGRLARPAGPSRRSGGSPARAGRTLRDHDAEPGNRHARPRHAPRDRSRSRTPCRRRQARRLRRLRRGRAARPRSRRRSGRACVIFRPTEHVPLSGGPWDERLARYAIADIVDETVAAGPPGEAGVYAGVAGELYALGVLGHDVDWEPDEGDGPGFADGEVGIALASRDGARFRAAAAACIADPWNELLYGAGGALVAARLLGDDDVARDAVERLWSTWTFDSNIRACIWTEEFDGKREQFLGFAHGVAGNAYALLRAAPLQSREHQTELIQRTLETLERTALHDGKLVNWLPTPDSQIGRASCRG